MAGKLAAVAGEIDFRSCWNVVAQKKIDLGWIAELKNRGHELAVDGYNHDGRLFESHRTFTRRTKPEGLAIQQHVVFQWRHAETHIAF